VFADIVVAVILAIVGLAFCFAGYRFFLLLLPLWGFLAGFWLGASAITALFGDGFLSTATSWISGFVFGLVCAALSYLFYWLAIVFFSASIGASIGSGFMGAIGVDSRVLTWIVAGACAVALIVLVLAINLPKFLIVVVSAIAGATAMIASVLLLFDRIQRAELYHGAALSIINESFFWSLAWIILIIVGIMVQTFSTTDYYLETPEPPISAHA
jgi:hypothetical protein